jgi:hypothetical protein
MNTVLTEPGHTVYIVLPKLFRSTFLPEDVNAFPVASVWTLPKAEHSCRHYSSALNRVRLKAETPRFGSICTEGPNRMGLISYPLHLKT